MHCFNNLFSYSWLCWLKVYDITKIEKLFNIYMLAINIYYKFEIKSESLSSIYTCSLLPWLRHMTQLKPTFGFNFHLKSCPVGHINT